MATHEIRTNGGLASFGERSIGREALAIGAIIPMREKGFWHAKWTIYKFGGKEHDRSIRRHGEIKSIEDAFARGLRPYEIFEHEGNLLLNVGINQIWDLVCGTGGTQFGTAALMCVGTSTVVATATQTALVGTGTGGSATATMAAGYPTYGSSQLATWQASFGTAVANWVWNEIGVSAGVLLNRLVQSMGTNQEWKRFLSAEASGTTWVLALTFKV
jgi:hypothetical protein